MTLRHHWPGPNLSRLADLRSPPGCRGRRRMDSATPQRTPKNRANRVALMELGDEELLLVSSGLIKKCRPPP